ncbi:MAG: MFS transporter [Acidimicrobiales bacterium]
MWLVAAGAAVVAALLGLRTPVGTLVPPTGEKRSFLHPDAVAPGMVLLLGLVALAGFTSFVPLYVDDIGLDGAGPAFILYAGLILTLRLLGARIPDRLGAVPTATAALLAVMAGMAVMGLWASPAGLYLGTGVFSTGMALLFPAMFSTVMHAAPEDERSHAVGTFSLFFDLSQGIGAVVLGAVVALTAERGAFLASTVAAAAGLWVLRRKVEVPPPAETGRGRPTDRLSG